MVNVPASSKRLNDPSASGVRGVLEGLRVVVVDDDDDARELLAVYLGQRGAEVFVGDSASVAFHLVQTEQPDVLISDIAMPEEDGYMLIARVRALPEAEGTIPAIAVTAYASAADRARALAAGFNGHFPKPLDLEALVQQLVDIRWSRRG